MNRLHNVLLLLIIFILVGFTSYRLLYHQKFNEIDKILSEQNFLIRMDQVKSITENELYPLRQTKIYFGLDTLRTINLFDTIQESTIVYEFSGEACNGCIDSDISLLKK